MELGAKLNSKANVITIQAMQRKTNPPMMTPVHAMKPPASLVLRIVYSEIVPYVNAINPSKKLTGKQTNPVNGIGAIPPHKVSRVRMPRVRLMMEWRFVCGGERSGSFDSII